MCKGKYVSDAYSVVCVWCGMYGVVCITIWCGMYVLCNVYAFLCMYGLVCMYVCKVCIV